MRIWPRIHLAMPVLGKELIEQSQRKRTYILRFLYAIALFGFCAIVFKVVLMEYEERPVELLGSGRWMFEFLFWVQVGGVALLLPAMLCGSITSEKERNTFMLLMLCDLSPWEILLQKLLSRLMVIGTYVLLNLPLLAITYSLGGVSTEQLFYAGYALGLTALQVGTFALLCSAFFRTTAVAFIASYIGLGLCYAVLPITFAIMDEFRVVRIDDEYYGVMFPVWGYFMFVTETTWGGNPPSPLSWLAAYSSGAPSFIQGTCAWLQMNWPRVALAVDFVLVSLPALLSTGLFLLMARFFVIRRAMLRPRNPLLVFFRLLDRVLGKLNRRFAGGIELIRTRVSLPDERPVAWLERTRRAIAKPHYLIRIFVATTIPTVFFCTIIMMFGIDPRDGHMAFGVMVMIAWPPLALFLAILGAGTFSAERASQTLDVLVTTPLPTRQILSEKLSAMWRFAGVLALPLVILLGCDLYLRLHYLDWLPAYRTYPGTKERYLTDLGALAHLVFSILSLLVYIPLVVWVSVWLGMWMKTRTKAAIASVVTILGLCLVPFLIVVPVIVFSEMTGGDFSERDGFVDIMMLSPLMVVPSLEMSELPFSRTPLAQWGGPWAIFGLHFLGIGLLALGVRFWLYSRADKLLGRVA